MKTTIGLCLLIIFFSACNKEENITFNISKDRIGHLVKTNSIAQLDSIFASDSIVRAPSMTEDKTASGKIEVYEKGGAHLLSISPTNDSLPMIENIRIYDARYSTSEGVNVLSTFKDIKDKLKIKKVITSMNNVVILLHDSDLYFTISKDELPAELRFNNSDIDVVQIPDKAKIKYMMIGWN
ncbi:hypothetical protein [Muriicola sp.]|uniref:hypothetical protein n=1 Tax=Muriicola sp. TaxID=2020856 RepID=UPI003C781960